MLAGEDYQEINAKYRLAVSVLSPLYNAASLILW